jgi:hypothetical protein
VTPADLAATDRKAAAHRENRAETVLEAKLVAAYYTTLVDNGVGEELAESLTRDWHAWRFDLTVFQRCEDEGCEDNDS